MTALPVLHSIEFTVNDIDECLELLVDVMGLELVGRSRHPVLDADVAQVNSSLPAINLLCPSDTGNGRPLPNPDPRLSQLTFVVSDPDALATLRDTLVENGAAVVQRDKDLIVIDPQMIRGLLGADTAIVFSTDAGIS